MLYISFQYIFYLNCFQRKSLEINVPHQYKHEIYYEWICMTISTQDLWHFWFNMKLNKKIMWKEILLYLEMRRLSVRKIMNCNKSFIHILRFATPCSSYKITVWIIINAHGGVIMYAYTRKHFVCRFDVCVLAFAWISNELMQCAKTSFRLRDLPREH